MISGSVDSRGRPTIRLAIGGHDDEMLVTIDTGFNGDILLSDFDARAWGIEPSGVLENVVLGDGAIIETSQGAATIKWLGQLRDVHVLIAPNHGTRLSPDEPVALIGTRLLADDILEINFPAQTVVIRQAD